MPPPFFQWPCWRRLDLWNVLTTRGLVNDHNPAKSTLIILPWFHFFLPNFLLALFFRFSSFLFLFSISNTHRGLWTSHIPYKKAYILYRLMIGRAFGQGRLVHLFSSLVNICSLCLVWLFTIFCPPSWSCIVLFSFPFPLSLFHPYCAFPLLSHSNIHGVQPERTLCLTYPSYDRFSFALCLLMDMFQSEYSYVQVVSFISLHSCLFENFTNFHSFPVISFMSILHHLISQPSLFHRNSREYKFGVYCV